MKTISYLIKDTQGIHARPAGDLVKTAKAFSSHIQIGKNGHFADAKKIFGIMGLAAKQGDTIELSIDGEDETEAATALSAFLEANL